MWPLTIRDHGDRSTPPSIPEAVPQADEEDNVEDIESASDATGNEALDSDRHLEQLESLDVSIIDNSFKDIFLSVWKTHLGRCGSQLSDLEIWGSNKFCLDWMSPWNLT